MKANSQDILNLANAYAILRQNRDRGGGYSLSDRYSDGILDALEDATSNYLKALNGVPTND